LNFGFVDLSGAAGSYSERFTRFAFSGGRLHLVHSHQLCILSWNKKISTVKGNQYIIYCRFEIIAVDMNTVLEKPAAQA
jgi:hypothetical protein